MESAMQQILEALGHMEERLTATLGGRCDAIGQRSTTTVANVRGGRVGLDAGAPVVVDNFSFDSFQGSTTTTTSSIAAPMYDDDVFASSATSAYDDEFGSSATSVYDDVTTRATVIFGGQTPPKISPLPPKISYFRRQRVYFRRRLAAKKNRPKIRLYFRRPGPGRRKQLIFGGWLPGRRK
jgi:hypothetical protein